MTYELIERETLDQTVYEVWSDGLAGDVTLSGRHHYLEESQMAFQHQVFLPPVSLSRPRSSYLTLFPPLQSVRGEFYRQMGLLLTDKASIVSININAMALALGRDKDNVKKQLHHLTKKALKELPAGEFLFYHFTKWDNHWFLNLSTVSQTETIHSLIDFDAISSLRHSLRPYRKEYPMINNLDWGIVTGYSQLNLCCFFEVAEDPNLPGHSNLTCEEDEWLFVQHLLKGFPLPYLLSKRK